MCLAVIVSLVTLLQEFCDQERELSEARSGLRQQASEAGNFPHLCLRFLRVSEIVLGYMEI
jgi:hypothetical protein